MCVEKKLKGHYAPQEMAVFKAAVRVEYATTEDMIPVVYPKTPPFTAEIVVRRAIRTLGKRLELNQEPYRMKEERVGHEIVFKINNILAADYFPKTRREAREFFAWCQKHLDRWDWPDPRCWQPLNS